ncbi:NAD(P)-binding protein [Xylariaceae sp. FL0594]|nr:NAD(P)-binding protein [Xylariaceae sp. FL0594]
MGNLLILGDSEIHDILISLSRTEIYTFRDAILQCLTDFSVGAERKHQPQPGVVNRPEGQRCLFRPFTSASSVGAKIVVQPAASSKAAGALHGMIAICDADGLPSGILNAEEVTGYRTSLSALIPWVTWRKHTENIVVFGAGKQALWHLRLALALRGEEIKSIVVINRTVSRAEALIAKVKEENETRWKSDTVMQCVDPSRDDYQGVLKGHLAIADAVFCTAGAKAPLFPARYVTEGRNRQPYISAIGSWQPDMIELDPELLRHLGAHRPQQPSGGEQSSSKLRGALLVDDRETVVPHTGELLQSKLGAEHIYELGEIADQLPHCSADDKEILQEWLSEGLLVYKSIGVGMTDLAASNAILEFARKRGLGTTISQF